MHQVEYPHDASTHAPLDTHKRSVLGAGRRTHAPEFGGETVNRPVPLERLRYAALARRDRSPVLVSGGASTARDTDSSPDGGLAGEDFRMPRLGLVESLTRHARKRTFSVVQRSVGVSASCS